jgi:single-strand DNA-binding protein
LSVTDPPDRAKEDLMNRVNLTAYLTRDPERVDPENGTPFCLLRIGVDRAGRGDKDGYWDVKVYDPYADACLEHLSKGRQVAVDGHLEFQEWEPQDGGYASRTVIVADRGIEFLPRPRRRNGSSESQSEIPEEQPAAQPDEADAAVSS